METAIDRIELFALSCRLPERIGNAVRFFERRETLLVRITTRGGAIGWVFLMTMLGYVIGSIPVVRHYFDKVILLIILISLLPTIIEVMRARGESHSAAHKAGGE